MCQLQSTSVQRACLNNKAVFTLKVLKTISRPPSLDSFYSSHVYFMTGVLLLKIISHSWKRKEGGV